MRMLVISSLLLVSIIVLWALFYNYSIVDTVDYSNEELNKLAELLNENNFELLEKENE